MLTKEDIDRLTENADQLTEEELNEIVTVQISPYQQWQNVLREILRFNLVMMGYKK